MAKKKELAKPAKKPRAKKSHGPGTGGWGWGTKSSGWSDSASGCHFDNLWIAPWGYEGSLRQLPVLDCKAHGHEPATLIRDYRSELGSLWLCCKCSQQILVRTVGCSRHHWTRAQSGGCQLDGGVTQKADRLCWIKSFRWDDEFKNTAGTCDPWPLTSTIKSVAWGMRAAKAWLPLIAGLSFLIALTRRW